MKYFPIFIDSRKINAIVIGGGDVAARKIELLLKSTTNITVMAAQVSSGVLRLIEHYQLDWLEHNYQAGFFNDKTLVIAATDNHLVNKAIAEEAEQLKLLVNVVDQPDLCSYITPAIIDRSPMIVAISSSGSAPVLVRMLREQIDKLLPDAYGKLASFSFKFRDHVKARVKGMRNRRLFWENTLTGNIGQAVLSGHATHAEQKLIASLKQQVPPPEGEIVFIHTLGGDPDNLTLKAHREMQFADAVFYDSQVNEQLIDYVRRDAEKYPQNISSTILVNYQHAIELAEQGQKVIYLLAGNEVLPENAALKQSLVNKQTLLCGG
jgi:uroporphyrin-III C-methyltransferase / precorrin-2 dehydrogenase / sirohydrochlorin ferrochelatase